MDAVRLLALFLSWLRRSGFVKSKCLRVEKSGFTVLLTEQFIYLSFFFPLVMFLPFPSSSRRSPACPQTMRIWSFPFSMFCVHLPRLLLNCMMKHSPTSTKVSVSVLKNLFVVVNKLTAAENKNHWQIIHFPLSCSCSVGVSNLAWILK